MINVVSPGLYSTIQDKGRINYEKYGVPASGTMDSYSARMANALVGNSEETAVLELTMTGPKLKFTCNTLIAISGANMNPKINNIKAPMNSAISINRNDVLSFGVLEYGFRSYLAVFEGFQSEEVLGSRSMYKDITAQFRLSKGDVLPINEFTSSEQKKHASLKIRKDHFFEELIEVYPGPEFEQLDVDQKNRLLSSSFTVSKDNSRMAYQLSEPLENNLKPIITSLVMPGTVQLTPSGMLIVLMRDCQTSGGYPRILQLNELAITKLSQKRTGNTIKFLLIDYV